MLIPVSLVSVRGLSHSYMTGSGKAGKTHLGYIQIFRELRVDHHEVFAACDQAVNVVVCVKMNYRSCTT